MKNLVKFFLVFLLFVVSLLLYIKFDKKGYDYGLGCVLCNKKMPFNIKPYFNLSYPQEFILLGSDGFELVSSGFKFEKSDIVIQSLLGYGYNDSSIFIKCLDEKREIKYLTSFIKNVEHENQNRLIGFKNIDFNIVNEESIDYLWFDINEEKVNEIRFFKSICFVTMIVSLLFLFAMFVIRKRKLLNS